MIGILGAARNGTGMQGVAYEANILALRTDLTSRSIVQSFAYAVETRASILNGSFGPDTLNRLLSNFQLNFNYKLLNFQPLADAVEDFIEKYQAVKSAAAADIVLVFSAGNEFIDQPTASTIPGGISMYPLVTPGNTAAGLYKFTNSGQNGFDLQNPNTYSIINPNNPSIANLDFSDLRGRLSAVVAVGPENEIAVYSNRCGLAAEWCLAAPTGNGFTDSQIFSTLPVNAYGFAQGTSEAAPHVAGAAAVVRQAFPFMNARQTIETILTTATYIGPAEIFGQGLLNVGVAINGPMKFRYADVFDVDTKGYSSTWSNSISGPGNLTKRNNGTLRLSAENSYTGATKVLGRTLTFNGNNVTDVTVAQTGRPSGMGTVRSIVNEAGEIVAPGEQSSKNN